MSDLLPITVTVNGAPVSATVEPRLLLVDFVRRHAGATGAHIGCEQGVCGACTLALDGTTVRGCLTFAVQADGCAVTTVEGLAGAGPLTHLQAALHECHALQCGYCTPGFLMRLSEFLAECPAPSDNAIIEVLGDNLCRCTGYHNIAAAVRLAATRMAAARIETGR